MLKHSDAEMFSMLDEALGLGYEPVAHEQSAEMLGLQPAEVSVAKAEPNAGNLVLGGLQQQIQHAHKPAA